jgi:hypothetical protein
MANCASPDLTEAHAGICIGPAWVEADHTSAPTEGPDFTVARLTTTKGEVGIYEGCCSQVSSDRKEFFTRIDGQTVYRTSDEDGFSGYLATKRTPFEYGIAEHQAHFFGVGLTGDARDKAFFKRVRFGPYAETKCNKGRTK